MLYPEFNYRRPPPSYHVSMRDHQTSAVPLATPTPHTVQTPTASTCQPPQSGPVQTPSTSSAPPPATPTPHSVQTPTSLAPPLPASSGPEPSPPPAYRTRDNSPVRSHSDSLPPVYRTINQQRQSLHHSLDTHL